MRSRLLSVLSVSLCVVMMQTELRAQATAAAPAATAAAPAYRSEPKFLAAMKEAKQQERQRHLDFAEDAYRKANKLAGGECVECLEGQWRMEFWLGSGKHAVETANAMLPLASAPSQRAQYLVYLGQSMLLQAGKKPKPAQLDAVHATLQQAIAAAPHNPNAYFVDGKLLAQMGQMQQARADFEQCVAYCSPKDPSRLRAQHFAADPELSLHKMAPAFQVTALDGSKFNLDAMDGRVVLIDFWATWCGPCNEELPHMKRLAKDFAGQPLVILSISWDSNEAQWKKFITDHQMTWEQYRDADHKLSDMFEVNAIPHYFTIDADGVMTAEMVGSGNDVEGRLKKLIAKARESKTTPAVTAAVSQHTDRPAAQVALGQEDR